MLNKMVTFFLLLCSFTVFAQATVFSIGEANKQKSAVFMAQKTDWEKKLFSYLSYYREHLDFQSDTSLSKYSYKIEVKENPRQAEIKVEDLLNHKSTNIVVPNANLRVASHEIIKYILKTSSTLFAYNIIVIKNIDKNPKIKELFECDFLGDNCSRLTFHNGIVIAPSVNKQGDKVLYSVLAKVNNKYAHALYVYNFSTHKSELFYENSKLIVGPSFSSDETGFYYSGFDKKSADIFYMDFSSKIPKKIVESSSLDVSPNVVDDLMVFLSDRSGNPMIYLKNLSSSEQPKRISFVGKFNSFPQLAHDKKSVVFGSWVDNRFDLYRLNLSNNQIFRLTKNLGSNEEGFFSADSNFIYFVSDFKLTNAGNKKLYLIDSWGQYVWPLNLSSTELKSPRIRKVFN